MADVSLTISGNETVSKAATNAAKGIEVLDKKIDDSGKSVKKVTKDFKDLTDKIDDTGKTAAEAAKGVDEVGKEAKKVSPQVQTLQKQIDKLATELTRTKKESDRTSVSVTGFGKPLKNVTGLISRFGGELGSSVGSLGKLGTSLISTFASGGAIALGVTAVVSGVSLLTEKLTAASRAAEEATKKQVDGWTAVLNTLTETNDKALEQIKIRKMISDGLDPRLVEFELAINKLTKEREPLLRAVEKANNAVAEAHANMVSAPGNQNYVKAWQNAVDEAAKHQKQLDVIQSKLAGFWTQRDLASARISVEDAVNGSPLLSPEEKGKGLGVVPGKDQSKTADQIAADRAKAQQNQAKRIEDAKKALETWNNALRSSVEREKQALKDQSDAALKAAETLKLSEAEKAKIKDDFAAKIAKVDKDYNDKVVSENQAAQDRIYEIIAQGKPLKELELQEALAIRKLDEMLAKYPQLQAEYEAARTSIVEDFSRRRSELADKEAKKLAKETDIWGNQKLTQEEANQKAQYEQGVSWANTIAQGFKESFESGDALGLFKASLSLIASLLSTFGGPAGALSGGILGIVGGLFEDGGNPQAIQTKRPPERRSGGPTFSSKGEFSDGRPFVAHADEFVWSAPAVAGAGGMGRVAQMHEDARLGRSPVASPSRASDAGLKIEVHSLDAGGTVDTLRRTLNPANVKLLDYRQSGLLLHKLRVARV